MQKSKGNDVPEHNTVRVRPKPRYSSRQKLKWTSDVRRTSDVLNIDKFKIYFNKRGEFFNVRYFRYSGYNVILIFKVFYGSY